MRRSLIAAAGVLAALISGGCLDVPSVSNTSTLPFDFSVVGENYSLVSADYPAARVGDVSPDGGLRNLPSPLPTQPSLFTAATNVTGSAFVLLKKHLTGLPPGTTYSVSISLDYASNISSGCTTGLGPAVFLKAGATSTEPVAVADGSGNLRMNINKGTGSAGGDYTALGDIRNGTSGCPTPGVYTARSTIYQNQPVNLTTDANGGFWLWVATESTAPGRHEVYFIKLNLRLSH